jgi:hypothetical protein
MKLVLSVIIFFFYLFAPFEANSASCIDRALNCVARWGSPPNSCYDAFRLAACEKTGKYVAPNGNVWPAIRPEGATRADR